MAKLRTVTRSSIVAAPPDEVWERVTSPEGVNDELRPWLKMTVPPGWRERSIGDVEPPEDLGRSWLLAFGLLPIDYDRIGIAEIGERRFQEDSTMLTMSVWRHERVVTPEGGGSRVTDTLEMRARWPLRWVPRFTLAYSLVVGRLFAHRHRRLQRWARRRDRRGILRRRRH